MPPASNPNADKAVTMVRGARMRAEDIVLSRMTATDLNAIPLSARAHGKHRC